MARILIVEENHELAEEIRDWLEADRHRVQVAANGKEGANRLRFFEYDLAVLDATLSGTSGAEICKELRARMSNVPVLMLTPGKVGDDKNSDNESCANAYLPKPVEMRQLIAQVKTLLDSASAAKGGGPVPS